MEWTIIGAGPAGIAAIGKLLDRGVNSKEITWIDPAFKVGDLGEKWKEVSSNTSVKLFLDFLNEAKSFECQSKTFPLHDLPHEETCKLSYIVEPLQWISDHFKVNKVKGFAKELELIDQKWHIRLEKKEIISKNVVLAIGADPSTLSIPFSEIISIEEAMNPSLLKNAFTKEDTIGVFGSSHTAIIVLYNLIDLGVKEVVNFYRSPLKFAVNRGDWILFDNTGLKGYSAKWARKYINGKHPSNLKRVFSKDPTYEEELAKCTKLVYATGFRRRKLPVVIGYDELGYNETSGIIAPGLFGLGIAFPEGRFDPMDNYEYRVGLWKFMDYLNRILPIWEKYTT